MIIKKSFGINSIEFFFSLHIKKEYFSSFVEEIKKNDKQYLWNTNTVLIYQQSLFLSFLMFLKINNFFENLGQFGRGYSIFSWNVMSYFGRFRYICLFYSMFGRVLWNIYNSIQIISLIYYFQYFTELGNVQI